jgi:RHS repeat-associated protein
VTWNLAVATGTYKVYARWPANSTHSAQAVYRVTHASGTTDVTVNQRLDGAEWNLRGTFSLNNANSKVTLIPQADGIVAADAVKAVNTSEASRIFFIHTDHLNAPRVVLNSANQLRWRWLSDPFGLLPPEDNPQGLGVFSLNLRLPGQLYDIESNLHYNYFRDYNPSTGRYTTSDPIGLAGGINTYTYVGGNPVTRVDPTGLRWDCQSFGFGTRCTWVPDDPLSPLIPAPPPPSTPRWPSPNTTDICLVNPWLCVIPAVLDWMCRDRSEEERCKKADEECYQQCEHLLGQPGVGGRTNQGAPYRTCWRNCMKAKNCYKGDAM